MQQGSSVQHYATQGHHDVYNTQRSISSQQQHYSRLNPVLSLSSDMAQDSSGSSAVPFHEQIDVFTAELRAAANDLEQQCLASRVDGTSEVRCNAKSLHCKISASSRNEQIR